MKGAREQNPTPKNMLITATALLACGFSVQPAAPSAAPCRTDARTIVRLCDEGAARNPLTGEPLAGGLWAKMVFRGPGSAMMYYLDDMREMFEKVDSDGDGYINQSELNELMSIIEKPQTDEAAGMMATIERELDITKRDVSGAPLIFAEQWAKTTVDMVRAEKEGAKKEGGGFKFPWQ